MLKLGCVGACRTADTAESVPASAHVIALTRSTEIPHRRAPSALLAAARICLPNTVYFMNHAKAATRTGATSAVSTYIPVNLTPPMWISEWNGCGYAFIFDVSGPRSGM